MKKIDALFQRYGESHQNPTNKKIHWVCIPMIFFSIIGLLMQIPFFNGTVWYLNWAVLGLAGVWFYFARLSPALLLGFIAFGTGCLIGNWQLTLWCAQNQIPTLWILILVFTLAWIGQFWGHKIEGKKPSFFEDLQYLLIGPAWLMHYIYRKLGWPY